MSSKTLKVVYDEMSKELLDAAGRVAQRPDFFPACFFGVQLRHGVRGRSLFKGSARTQLRPFELSSTYTAVHDGVEHVCTVTLSVTLRHESRPAHVFDQPDDGLPSQRGPQAQYQVRLEE